MTDATLSVLLVDDDKTQYEMVSDYLQLPHANGISYFVDWAANFEEGMHSITTKHYDVCLVDYELGNKSGLDFIRTVTEQKLGTPLILLTGHGSFRVDLEAMQAGAVDYLDKTALRANTLERSIRYATENQRLLEKERRQRTITEVLLDTALALNSSFDFDEVLDRILSNTEHVIPHQASNIALIEDKKVNVVRLRGYPDERQRKIAEAVQFTVTDSRIYQQMMITKTPLLINDVNNFEGWRKIPGRESVRSYMGVPIIIHEEVIGFLNFDGYQQGAFTEEYAHYSHIFATQAAQAIRNTRAYQQAQALAAAHERQRLARDLHDAVSQTLFSASVIAQTLPRLIDQDPAEVRSGLDELNRLNRSALAEMRTLLVELRPQSLIETDLRTLIRYLINAFTSRASIEVESRINYSIVLPEEVHIVFYRIVQEALNNIQKYAQARNVSVELVQINGHLQLRIEDDGIGFDPRKVSTGHLGLKIMQERAQSINAKLQVLSNVKGGTTIQLTWATNHGEVRND